MRVEVTKGKDPIGLCQYLLNPQKQKQADLATGRSPVLSKNMFGRDAYELAEEFRFSHDLNPRVQRTMVHYSVSLPPGEQVADDQKRAIAQDLLKHMGHGDCQYFVVAHHDQEHKLGVQHWHIATSAVDLNGHWVPDHFNYLELKQVERELEQKYGLQLCPPKSEGERQNLTTGEHRLKERTGETLPKEKLWQAIDLAAADRPTMPQLVTRLKAQGVEVRFSEFDQGKQRQGISFAIPVPGGSTNDERHFQGRQLGKAYTLNGLKQHRGVDYVPERDDDLLRHLNGLSSQECRALVQAKPQPEAATPEPSRSPVQNLFADLRPHVEAEAATAMAAIPYGTQALAEPLGTRNAPAGVENPTPQAAPATPAPATPLPIAAPPNGLQQPQVVAGVVLQPPAPESDQWIAAQLILDFVRQRLDEAGLDQTESSDERYLFARDPHQGGIVIYDQECGEPIALGKLTPSGWQIAHADIGGEDATNFLHYQQAQHQARQEDTAPEDKLAIE